MIFKMVILFGIAAFSSATHFEDEEPCVDAILIAFSNRTTIANLHRDTGSLSSFTDSTSLGNAVAIAADQANGFVFFTDVERRVIWKKDFKTPEDSTIIKALNSGSYPGGIAVDSVRQQIFYTDEGAKIIAKMNYDGSSHQIILDASNNLDRPRAIIVDPESSRIYYSDVGVLPHISKADYNGENILVLIDNDIDTPHINLASPNSLAANFAESKLYWCDSGLEDIAVINTDGTNALLLFATDTADLEPFGLILVHDELIVSDRYHKQLFSLPLNEPDTLSALNAYSHGISPNGIAQICIPGAEESPAENTVQSSSSTNSSGGSATLIIIIIIVVVVVVVVVGIVALTVWCCVRARSTNNAAGTILSTDLTSRPPAYTDQRAKYPEPPVSYVKDPEQLGNQNPGYVTMVPPYAGGVPTITDEYLHPIGQSTMGAERIDPTYMTID